jgi:hypothetical protein
MYAAGCSNRGLGARGLESARQKRVHDAGPRDAVHLLEGIDRVEHAAVERPAGGRRVAQTPELVAEL